MTGRAIVYRTVGNSEIAGAIVQGMHIALPAVKPLNAEEKTVVMNEIDDQKKLRKLVRVSVGNTNTPEDYECMMVDANWQYRKLAIPVGPVRRTFLVAWACLWVAIFQCFDYLSKWNRES